MKTKSTAIILFILIVFGAQGQKIKYKNLYPLLEAKNYEEAIPQLKLFLWYDNEWGYANRLVELAAHAGAKRGL